MRQITSSHRIRQIFCTNGYSSTVAKRLVIIHIAHFTPILKHHIRSHRQTIVVHVCHTCSKCCWNAASNNSVPCYRGNSRITIASLRNFVRIVAQIMPRRKYDSQCCNMLFSKLVGVLCSKIQFIALYSHIRLYCNRKYTRTGRKGFRSGSCYISPKIRKIRTDGKIFNYFKACT